MDLEVDMTQEMECRRDTAAAEKVEFAHYPDNNLGQQQRPFEDVPSLHEVLLAHFKSKA